MAKLTTFFSLIVVLILFTYGSQIIAQDLQAQHLGNYVFLWRNATDNTLLTAANATVQHNLTLQRISSLFTANLTVTSQGCNGSDIVRLEGTFIGNLSATPKTFAGISGDILAVATDANYTIFTGCNVTQSFIVYYSWDGCDYDIDTCEALDASFNMTAALMKVPPYLLFMLMLLPVFLVLFMFAGWFR